MKDLFLHDSQDDSPVVFSDRVLYTPTSFAKTALLYLQEIGSLQAKKPHTGQGVVISMPRCTVWKQMWQRMWKECTQTLLIRSLQ